MLKPIKLTIDTILTVNHPSNIKRRERLDEIKLTILNDVVDSCISCINSAGFPISKQYQSSKSYTYYIQFQPITESGEKLIPVELMFRISGDHKSQSIAEDVASTSTVIIKSITLGQKEYESYPQVILALQDICNELKQGNINVLSKYTFGV